jgi:replicative DNA helicase
MLDSTNTPGVPANMEAEQAVLGSILIDAEVIAKVAPLLKPADFFREQHAWIYAAMLDLRDKHEPIDFVTISAELERRKRMDEMGGPGAITELLMATPTSFYAEHYAKLVAVAAHRRRLISMAGKIAELAYDSEQDITAIADQVQAMALTAGESTTRKGLKHVAGATSRLIDRIDFLSQNRDSIMGVPTGFKLLDYILGGFQKSDLITLAARPGMGKSALAFTVAYSAAKNHGTRVAVFSLEMSDEQFVQRLLSQSAGIDSHLLRTGAIQDNDWENLLTAANELSNLPIFIDDTGAISISHIRSECRRMAAEDGLDFVIVDYMQLMSGTGKKSENRQQEISDISRSLKALARELDVPVLALSQLSRAVESRMDKRPMLSDLRESGAIEQDSDVVLFIYREDYYVEDTDRQNIADVIVAKHRHGAVGTVSLFFRKELTQFRELEIERTDLNNY